MSRPDPSAQPLDAYELTPMQQGMLYHALRESGTGVDVEQIVMDLLEALDVEVFERAWEHVLKRHTILRTRLRWEDVAEPRQEVVDTVELPITIVDWSGHAAADIQSRFTETLRADRHADFDLAKAPLMRLLIARLGSNRFRVLWTFHHALLDGRSFTVVLRELFAVYEAFKAAAPTDLPQPTPFRAYIEWRRSQDFSRSESFWRKRLQGFHAPTPFRVDAVDIRDGSDSQRGSAAKQMRLSASVTEQLRAMAQTNEVTLNTLLQAAWAVLLHRYSGESDVVFGATRAGRGFACASSGEMVGPFINTLPVRTVIEPTTEVGSWLKLLREQHHAVRPHEFISLATVQSASAVQRGLPLFESVVVYEHRSLDAQLKARGKEWANRTFEYIGQTNFPLAVIAYGDDELLIRLEYSTRRFSDRTIERMLRHLSSLLTHLSEGTASQVSDLRMLTADERRELLSEGEAPARFPVHDSLHQRFAEQALLRPKATALVEYDDDGARVELSYAELDARASDVAQALRARGAGPGCLIGLRTERNAGLVIGLLGILKTGAAYLPLDPGYPLDRVRFMLSDGGVRLVLTQRRFAEALDALSVDVLCLDEPMAMVSASHATPPNARVPSCEDLAYVIYTSGSTGQPKGVGISHRNVLRLFAATERWFGFHQRDVWTLFHSYAFDFSVWELWGALLHGGCVVVVPQDVSRNPVAFRDLLLREGVTVLNQTPTAFRQLIDADRTANAATFSLRHVIFGGEALELQSLRTWIERHGDQCPRLINMYGITETTVHVTYRPITRADLDAGSGSLIGRPIPDLRIYLLDPTGQPVPYGAPGEIFVAGEGVAAAGYLNRPELTAQRFVPNPFVGDPACRMYRSGDLARRFDNGELEYLGRIDQQVKIRGFRIELGEIEACIARHPGVRQVAVIDREDEPGQKRLVAYLVSDGRAASLLQGLRERLRSLLPDYMVPAHFVFIRALPLTANGKLDRRALPAPEIGRPDKPFTPPRNATERAIAEVWQSVLRIERVSVDDHFFELGGDSILSIQVVVRCRQKGLHLTPKHLFEHPTVAQLAAVATEFVQTAKPIREVSGDVPLTPIQHWFFEQRFHDAHHWNQAFLFETQPGFDCDAFERALSRVAQVHDALRLRFAATGSAVTQIYTNDTRIEVERVDLSEITREQQEAALTQHASDSQTHFDLSSGPLACAVHFRLGPNVPGRLLVAIHHLVVDGVSWRIFREEVEAAYNAIKSATAPPLAEKTNSMQDWSQRLLELAQTPQVQSSLAYWREVVASSPTVVPSDAPDSVAAASAPLQQVVKKRLTAAETDAVLHQAPKVFRSHTNDVLIAALAQALQACFGGQSFRFDLEGHGREHIADDVDVSRTVGWFTTLFPAAIHIREADPIGSLLEVRDQLRRIPLRGLAYGLLRHLSRDDSVRKELASAPASTIVFNYLGQFDSVVADSQLLRFACESTGPWRSPNARRPHAIEIIAVCRGGSLEIECYYDANIHRSATIDRLAETLLAKIRGLVSIADSAPVVPLTPVDVPLANLDAHALAQITSRYSVQDIYPLTAMQQLFFAMEMGRSEVGLEQWQFRIEGLLETTLLRQAVELVVERHAILRTAFVDAGAKRGLQVVCERAELPWFEQDWRPLSKSEQDAALASLMRTDSSQVFDLSRPPALRMTLCRTEEREWVLLWSTHHLCIDGWSWSLVLQDVSHAYSALIAGGTPEWPATIPYRTYVDWLTHSSPNSEAFWRQELASIAGPTPLRLTAVEASEDTRRELTVQLDKESGESLHRIARDQKTTLNVLLTAAWAVALSHYSGSTTVLMGAAFSGRPAELAGIDTMVGPCVNNLPVRADVVDSETLPTLFRRLQERQFDLAQNQYSSLEQIQQWSSVPWRHRLFDSLIVFQNYQVDPQAGRIGQSAEVTLLAAPEATNYPLTLAITVVTGLRIRLIRQPELLAFADIEQFATDLVALLRQIARDPFSTVATLRAVLAPDLKAKAAALAHANPTPARQPFAAAGNDMEELVAQVWAELFSVERISVDENFFELGGHSMLLIRAHSRLCERLGTDLPVVALLQYPTIRSLARHLGGASARELHTVDTAIERARRQREARARQRALSVRV